MQLLRHYHISPSKKLHGIITVLYFIKHCFFLQSIMWNCPTYDKFYIGISQRLCSFFLCTVLHHKLWFENRTALCYNKSNTRIPLFWQQVCSCREGSCGAKILKISCAWTGWPGAVGFLTPTKKRAASYPFLRGIYVAFFGCTLLFSGVRANAPIWQKSQRYFDAAVWVTHLRREPTWFSVWMGNKIFRLYGGEKAGLRPEVPANDQSAWLGGHATSVLTQKGEFLSVRMRTKLCVAQNIKTRQRKREISRC